MFDLLCNKQKKWTGETRLISISAHGSICQIARDVARTEITGPETRSEWGIWDNNNNLPQNRPFLTKKRRPKVAATMVQPMGAQSSTGTVGHDTMLRRSFLSCPKSAAGSCDCCLPSRVWWGRLISASCICEGGALRCPLTHFTPQLLPDRLKLTDLHPRLRRHPINFNQSLD
jgi:hypothetical protein